MRFLLAVSLLLLASATTAQTTYRWIDKEGKVHYTDRPPATNEANKVEKKRSTELGADQTISYALRKAVADYPVTLYTQTSCGDVCKEARDFLAKRGVPFSEKGIAGSDDADALRALVGPGDLVVPVMLVGRKVAKGYLRSDWEGLLDAAGYPKSGANTPAKAPATP